MQLIYIVLFLINDPILVTHAQFDVLFKELLGDTYALANSLDEFH